MTDMTDELTLDDTRATTFREMWHARHPEPPSDRITAFKAASNLMNALRFHVVVSSGKPLKDVFVTEKVIPLLPDPNVPEQWLDQHCMEIIRPSCAATRTASIATNNSRPWRPSRRWPCSHAVSDSFTLPVASAIWRTRTGRFETCSAISGRIASRSPSVRRPTEGRARTSFGTCCIQCIAS
jgi:hypothetical protein